MAKKKQDDEWLSWGLIIFLFIIGLSPVALILLFVKLFGDDTKTVQNNLGHSTPSTTLAIYAHVTERMKTQSASRMQAYIEAVQE